MASDLRVRGSLSHRLDLAIGLGMLVVLAAVWVFVTHTEKVPALFLPKPVMIWEGLAAFQERGWLTAAILRSTGRVLLALLLTMAIGIPIGVLMGAFPVVDAALRKIVNAGKSLPATGLVGLIVLWFSIEERAKIVFLFIGAIFYMILLVKNSVSAVSEEYVRIARDIGATDAQIVQKILLPGALPQMWDAISACSGIMWTYIVLAEFINSNEEQLGLGYLLQLGSRTNNSGQVFGVLILIGLISSLSDWLFSLVRRKFFAW